MWFEIYQNFNFLFPDRHHSDRYQPMGYQQRQPFPRFMKILPVPFFHFNINNKPNAYKNRTQSQPYISQILQTKIAKERQCKELNGLLLGV